LVSQAVAAQSASSVLQVVVQQLPLPLRPHTPDWQASLDVQAVPSGNPLCPVVVPPVADPPIVAVPPEVLPDPSVLAGPVVVPVVVGLLEELQAVPNKMANPAAAVIAFRMCRTSFVNASRRLPNAKPGYAREMPRAVRNL
jgi:hypothetical protein